MLVYDTFLNMSDVTSFSIVIVSKKKDFLIAPHFAEKLN
jgi:hypothetical protein